MQQYLRYSLLTILLLVVQTTIIPFVSIENIVPDLLLIWIVLIAIQLGQIPATVAGFAIGLVIDLVSGHFIGLSALSKTVAGFFAGYFFNENKRDMTLGSYQFLIIVGLTSLIHNIIYFVIFVQGSDVSFWTAIFRFGLFSTVYTIALAVLPVFAFSRKLA
ncbi:MAG TPA: rod shape-determining protein MreD [Bacteroidota bacterium]|nr:rod shape-determining protein MreD [Bacteroidota bacterium]